MNLRIRDAESRTDCVSLLWLDCYGWNSNHESIASSPLLLLGSISVLIVVVLFCCWNFLLEQLNSLGDYSKKAREEYPRESCCFLPYFPTAFHHHANRLTVDDDCHYQSINEIVKSVYMNTTDNMVHFVRPATQKYPRVRFQTLSGKNLECCCSVSARELLVGKAIIFLQDDDGSFLSGKKLWGKQKPKKSVTQFRNLLFLPVRLIGSCSKTLPNSIQALGTSLENFHILAETFKKSRKFYLFWILKHFKPRKMCLQCWKNPGSWNQVVALPPPKKKLLSKCDKPTNTVTGPSHHGHSSAHSKHTPNMHQHHHHITIIVSRKHVNSFTDKPCTEQFQM